MNPDTFDELVQLPGGAVPVRWRRSARARRVSMRIDAAIARVVVTLPARASRRSGMALLAGHADWVGTRLAALPIGGVPHVIRHIPVPARGDRFVARLAYPHLEVSGDAAFLPRRVGEFLRSEARRRLSARVQAVAITAGVAARRVTVKDTRSRWGSCSADRALSFSWRLLMAPEFVQEYVVAHEVAHLRHMDHGPAFWALVAELTPHRDAAGTWLARHGAALLRVG